MMGLKTAVIACQLDVIDNNNLSECTDEAATDMSRVLQNGLMGKQTDSTDFIDRRLHSTCLLSLSLSLSPLHFYKSSHAIFGPRRNRTYITSVFNWGINLINSLSLSVSKGQVSDSSRCVGAVDCLRPSIAFHTICKLHASAIHYWSEPGHRTSTRPAARASIRNLRDIPEKTHVLRRAAAGAGGIVLPVWKMNISVAVCHSKSPGREFQGMSQHDTSS